MKYMSIYISVITNVLMFDRSVTDVQQKVKASQCFNVLNTFYKSMTKQYAYSYI